MLIQISVLNQSCAEFSAISYLELAVTGVYQILHVIFIISSF